MTTDSRIDRFTAEADALERAAARSRRRGWALPTVVVEAPRCPACGSRDLKRTNGRRDQGDGSTIARATCLNCGEKMNVVEE